MENTRGGFLEWFSLHKKQIELTSAIVGVIFVLLFAVFWMFSRSSGDQTQSSTGGIAIPTPIPNTTARAPEVRVNEYTLAAPAPRS